VLLVTAATLAAALATALITALIAGLVVVWHCCYSWRSEGRGRLRPGRPQGNHVEAAGKALCGPHEDCLT
jgi:hypothetical protein